MLHSYSRGKVSKYPFIPVLLWLLLAGSTLLAQTRMVKQINPSGGNANPYGFVNVNGTVYFAADNGTQGVELWKTDGTEAGTTLVKDIAPGAEGSFPSKLTNVNGTLFFAAGSSLWKSNGTAAGTVPVKTFTSISWSATSFCNVNGVLYFAANDGVYGEELWKSDGTAAGTVLVKDILSGVDAFGYPAGSSPTNLFNGNGTLYFTAQNGGVYRSNGTAAGTFLLNSAYPSSFANYQGQVYFVGDGLWKTNGTVAGTVRVSTLPNPSGDGSFSGGASKLVVSNNALYFYTEADAYTNTVWRSDGTAAGTAIIKVLGSISTPTTSELVDVNGTVFFAHSIGTSNKALYKINGSTVSTVRDMGLGSAPDFSYFTSFNGYLFFPEYDGGGEYSELGTELWRSDGTNAGTVIVADINTTYVDWDASSYPMHLTSANGLLYFSAEDGVNGRELWVYDPAAIPSPVLRLNAGGPEYIQYDTYEVYSADKYVTGGSTAKLTNSPEIENTSLDTLHHTERWGTFSYSIPVKPGKYVVNLHFAEIYWGTSRAAGGVGSRKFNVDIEGTRRLTEYDIFATTGSALRADLQRFELEVTDEILNINFLPGTASQPKVSAIEVFPATPGPINNPPVLAAIGNKTVTAGQKLTFTAKAVDKNYPPQDLKFSLAGSVPAGAAIETSQAFVGYVQTASGAFSWTPTVPGTYTFRVKITDNGFPAASDEEQITVTVKPAPATTAFRVNAGGNAFSTIDARSFAADAYFSGGSVSKATALSIGGTADDYLYQTGRHGSSFAYNFPTGNGSYDVVLHFAETYWGNTVPGGIGSRKFHVNMEGVRRLTDYDVFARAGGALRVAQETFRVNVADGTLNVAFLKGAADNPAIKAIEVLPAGSALTINSGGAAYTTGAGKRFSADSYYASGSVSSIVGGEIANTTDDALYRNARVGSSFSYGLPSGNGTFNVTLHFAETFWGNRAAGGAGSRKFNVYVENVKRLSDYDVFAKAGGAMRAVKETVQVTVTDGILNLFFAKGTADLPLISAIEVVPVAATRVAAEDNAAGTETWKATLFPNPASDRLTVTLPFAADAVEATTVTDPAGNARLLDAHRVSSPDQLEIGVGTLPQGLYLLRINTTHGSQVLKFVKR